MVLPVPVPGDPTVFGVGAIISILGGLFGGLFGSGGAQQIQNDLRGLRDAMSRAIDTVSRYATKIARALGALLSAIHNIWVGFLGELWNIVKYLMVALRWLLREGLPRLVLAVRNLRRLLDDVYQRYIRPALNYIQLVRRYLAILRALHVPFADKLDRILVRIEGRIIAPYLYVLRTLNGIGGWVNVIVTGRGTIQRPLFLRTMYAYQADWVNMWWAAQGAVAGAGVPPSLASGGLPRSAAQVRDDMQLFATTGGGPVALQAERAVARAQAVLGG